MQKFLSMLFSRRALAIVGVVMLLSIITIPIFMLLVA